MKISLSIGSTYQIRSYYEDGEYNRTKNIDGSELETKGTSILLLDTIRKIFNELKNKDENYSDITEVEINIVAGGNFELGTFQEIVNSNVFILIKGAGSKPIQQFICKTSNQNLVFEGGLFHNLVFQDITCNSLAFFDLIIEKAIIFHKVIINHSLTFGSCSGTVVSDEETLLEFDECPMIKQLNLVRTSFSSILVLDSLIDKLFPYKIHFHKVQCIGNKNSFSDIELKYFFEDSSTKEFLKNSLTEIKDYYRQLKYSHDEIGNKTEANKFFAKEMEYYRKSLLDNYGWRTFFDIGIGQKRVVCWYNQLTNDFGNSWIRPPLIMVLLVGVATFYEFLNSTGSFNWNIQILSNILPISEIGKFTTWFDFFYQITWAALIYQFIIALRRISQR